MDIYIYININVYTYIHTYMHTYYLWLSGTLPVAEWYIRVLWLYPTGVLVPITPTL